MIFGLLIHIISFYTPKNYPVSFAATPLDNSVTGTSTAVPAVF